MMTLQVERFGDWLATGKFRDVMVPLFAAHFREIAKFKDTVRHSVNIQKYTALDQADKLHICTLRDSPGSLGVLGYSVHIIVLGTLHNASTVVAEDDVHYLVPSLRGTGEHERLRNFALATLKARGVQFVTARTKIGHPHETVLRRIGFEPLDQVYGLDLTKWTAPKWDSSQEQASTSVSELPI